MRRREFIAALGGAATFAFAARADDTDRVRRVGVLIYGAEDDPVTVTRVNGLRQGLRKLDWVEGRNLQMDFRFGSADPGRIRTYAKELVSLAPDVIVAGAAPTTHAVLAQTQTIPVVFVEAMNAVGAFRESWRARRPTAPESPICILQSARGGWSCSRRRRRT